MDANMQRLQEPWSKQDKYSKESWSKQLEDK
jgi:hypothetical protein